MKEYKEKKENYEQQLKEEQQNTMNEDHYRKRREMKK